MPPTYKQTQDYNYSDIHQIATLGFADVNAMTATQFASFLIAAGIPANVIVVGIYAKTVTAFASVTRGVQSGMMSLDTGFWPPQYPVASQAFNVNVFSTAGMSSYLAVDELGQWATAAQDLYLTLDWVADNNPQDYTAGQLDIYIETRPFPSLT